MTLKTGIGFKVTYGRVAKAVIRADCAGVVSYNLRNYDFTRVPRPGSRAPRPMFPFDEGARWGLPV